MLQRPSVPTGPTAPTPSRRCSIRRAPCSKRTSRHRSRSRSGRAPSREPPSNCANPMRTFVRCSMSQRPPLRRCRRCSRRWSRRCRCCSRTSSPSNRLRPCTVLRSSRCWCCSRRSWRRRSRRRSRTPTIRRRTRSSSTPTTTRRRASRLPSARAEALPDRTRCARDAVGSVLQAAARFADCGAGRQEHAVHRVPGPTSRDRATVPRRRRFGDEPRGTHDAAGVTTGAWFR